MQLEYISLTMVFLVVASSLNIPRSSVVLTGDKLEMNCSVTRSGFITWTYTSWNTSTERDIYRGGDIVESMRSRYKIDKNISGQHNLIIDSVDLAHAGRYKCTSGIERTLGTDIQLIVLGCEPKCDTNASLTDQTVIEHSYLWMWCLVNYTGNMIPIFNMTKENAQGDITDYASTADYYTIPLTITATVITQLNSDDNGAKIKLRITFQLSNSNGDTAFNIHSYTWNYTANVLYDASHHGTVIIGLLALALLVGLGVAIAVIARSCSQGKTSIKATSAEPDNEELQNEDTSYSTLNVQPSTTEESSAYCELRLFEKANANFKKQAREEKQFKSKTSKRKVLRGTGSAQLPPFPYQPNRQPSIPSVKLVSNTLSTIKRKDSKTTAISEDYCTLTHPQPTVEETQLYCELRLSD